MLVGCRTGITTWSCLILLKGHKSSKIVQKSSKFLALGELPNVFIYRNYETHLSAWNSSVVPTADHPVTIPCLSLYPKKPAGIRNSHQTAWRCLFPLGGAVPAVLGALQLGLLGWVQELGSFFPCPAAPKRVPEASNPFWDGAGDQTHPWEMLCANLGCCTELQVGVGTVWAKKFKPWWS